MLVDAVCTTEAPEDDSAAADILNLLREHRASAQEEQDDEMEANGMHDDDDEFAEERLRPWTGQEDDLLCKLAAAHSGPPSAKTGGKAPAAQLHMDDWREVAEHFDDRTALECANRYRKFLNPENIKGARQAIGKNRRPHRTPIQWATAPHMATPVAS